MSLCDAPAQVFDLGMGGRADAVVLAPHPDDEVFGAAALMCGLVSAGHRVRLVAVTDGEAAYGSLTATATAALVERRRGEREAALRRLGLGDAIRVTRLRLPDGAVADHVAMLTARVATMAPTVIVSTWRLDGHPDHEAVGRAAAVAAEIGGARLLEYPVWAIHRGRLDAAQMARAWHVPMPRDVRAAKIAAAGVFRSQLDPSPDGRPVVPSALLDRLAVDPEVVFG